MLQRLFEMRLFPLEKRSRHLVIAASLQSLPNRYKQAAKAARDTAQGISDTGGELHESQSASRIASAMHQTLSIVEDTGAKSNDTTAQLSNTAPRTTNTPLLATKRKRKSKGNTVTKNARKQLTTDKTQSQTVVKGLKRKTNRIPRLRKKESKREIKVGRHNIG